MAEGKKQGVRHQLKQCFEFLYNINYRFNDYYGISYLTYDVYENCMKRISFLRKCKEITREEYTTLRNLFEHQYNNLNKIKNLEAKEPRIVAQRFIGRKKIRQFIFKRDDYTCLKCKTKTNLSIDHILPIHTGGENKISNLQTLCKSCNSSKSTNYKDYR